MSKRAEKAAQKIFRPIDKGVVNLVTKQELIDFQNLRMEQKRQYIAGYEQAEKDIISLIKSRIGEILGDAQPVPVLRAELRELIKRIKGGTEMRCENCKDTLCPFRLTAGECRNYPNCMESFQYLIPTDFDGIKLAASDLVEAVEGYVCPKKDDKYVFRNEVLAKCNELKKLLNETE